VLCRGRNGIYEHYFNELTLHFCNGKELKILHSSAGTLYSPWLMTSTADLLALPGHRLEFNGVKGPSRKIRPLNVPTPPREGESRRERTPVLKA
jgi:hypothetical protein